jgi:hypothetical protein
MSVWRYREEAIRHLWEFVTLGYEQAAERSELHACVLSNPENIVGFIAEHRWLVVDVVESTPSRRPAMLRRMTKGDTLSQCALVLGAWQHCRKAVLAYDWLAEHEDRFIPGQPYRSATASQGILFDELKARKWTKWPFQWGPSPFPGERSRRHACDAPDFNEMMDNYDPQTGRY